MESTDPNSNQEKNQKKKKNTSTETANPTTLRALKLPSKEIKIILVAFFGASVFSMERFGLK